MGESACLVHSVSCAATVSRESKEDNPLHALSQSISFGRFMSESLDWEKWSSFSHKKYVEEVERYSQPGSVAQKKAFFEARYKKAAAGKRAAAAAALEEAVNNKTPSENAPESEPEHKQEVKGRNTETGLVFHADGSDLKTAKDDKSEGSMVQADGTVAKQEVLVENSMRVDSSKKPGVMENKDASQMIPDGVKQKENYTKVDSLKKNSFFGEKDEDIESSLKKIWSADKKGENRERLKKNLSDTSRMPKICSTPAKILDTAAKHPCSGKRREQIALDDNSDKARKSVRQRRCFLPLNCLFTPCGSPAEQRDERRKKKLKEKSTEKGGTEGAGTSSMPSPKMLD